MQADVRDGVVVLHICPSPLTGSFQVNKGAGHGGAVAGFLGWNGLESCPALTSVTWRCSSSSQLGHRGIGLFGLWVDSPS